MNKPSKIANQLFKNEALTESDAIHPRFVPETSEEINKCEKESYYYCRQCRLYFAPTYTGLKTHFTKEIVEHKPIGSCFYCKGKVYEYSLNEDFLIYHNCRDSLPNKSNSCSAT